MGLVEGCVANHGDDECDCVTRTIGPLTGGYELREIVAPGNEPDEPNGVGWLVHYPDRDPWLVAYIAPKPGPYRQVEGRGSTQGSWEVHQLLEWRYVVHLDYRAIHERIECWEFNAACDRARAFVEKARRRYPVKSDPTPPGAGEPGEPDETPPKPPRKRGPRQPKRVPDPLIRAMG